MDYIRFGYFTNDGINDIKNVFDYISNDLIFEVGYEANIGKEMFKRNIVINNQDID